MPFLYLKSGLVNVFCNLLPRTYYCLSLCLLDLDLDVAALLVAASLAGGHAVLLCWGSWAAAMLVLQWQCCCVLPKLLGTLGCCCVCVPVLACCRVNYVFVICYCA